MYRSNHLLYTTMFVHLTAFKIVINNHYYLPAPHHLSRSCVAHISGDHSRERGRVNID